jgi:RluA family pseudouridine synthase
MSLLQDSLVLWSDKAVLAINKPAGLPTLPDGYDREAAHVRSLLEPLYGRLWIVHRLDKETSGALLLARSAAAHRSLNLQFEAHQVEKVYHALAAGAPDWEATTCDLPLRPDGDRRHRTVVDRERGKPAYSELRRLEQFRGCCLVEICPRTGRTHQVRAHLAALGFPLIGDVLYGGPGSLPGGETAPDPIDTQEGGALIRRPALHALRLDLLHPQTGAALRLEAPYPADFAGALAALRQHTSER